MMAREDVVEVRALPDEVVDQSVQANRRPAPPPPAAQANGVCVRVCLYVCVCTCVCTCVCVFALVFVNACWTIVTRSKRNENSHAFDASLCNALHCRSKTRAAKRRPVLDTADWQGSP